jgi:hypothetical protein
MPVGKGVAEAKREKAAKCLQYRKAGLDWDTVARQVGYANRGTAWRAAHELLARIEEPAHEARALELARLDDLLSAVWAKAINGSLEHVDRAVKIIERRCRIQGIEAQAPTIVVQTDDRREILAFVQQVVRDPKAFEAARRLQQITDGALEVEAEVVENANGGSPSEGGE